MLSSSWPIANGLNLHPFVPMEVYKGDIAVYEIVCTPQLQSEGIYGCIRLEAWSLKEIQRIPAAGLWDLAVISLLKGSVYSTFWTAACRKSHTSFSSYDYSSYDVPSFIYRWNAVSLTFEVLLELGCSFRTIPSRRANHTMLRFFCAPNCKVAPDNHTYSVEVLRGATGVRLFRSDGELYFAVAQSVCEDYHTPEECYTTATQPRSALLQYNQVTKVFSEMLSRTDSDNTRLCNSEVPDLQSNTRPFALRLDAGRAVS